MPSSVATIRLRGSANLSVLLLRSGTMVLGMPLPSRPWQPAHSAT
jgi:hypothetical protein